MRKFLNREGRIEIRHGCFWFQTYAMAGWMLTPAIGFSKTESTEFYRGFISIEATWLKRQAILIIA